MRGTEPLCISPAIWCLATLTGFQLGGGGFRWDKSGASLLFTSILFPSPFTLFIYLVSITISNDYCLPAYLCYPWQTFAGMINPNAETNNPPFSAAISTMHSRGRTMAEKGETEPPLTLSHAQPSFSRPLPHQLYSHTPHHPSDKYAGRHRHQP